VLAGSALVLWARLSVPGTVAAQVQGDVALLSDYRFRGESLTEGRPALQAGVNYDHSSGLFVGGLVSNVRRSRWSGRAPRSTGLHAPDR
jgi:uncharacterized protein (TIGR02001 family)